jgi:hypothetical protein
MPCRRRQAGAHTTIARHIAQLAGDERRIRQRRHTLSRIKTLRGNIDCSVAQVEIEPTPREPDEDAQDL